jgi:methylglutaconyl-CoA hydratase
VPDLDVHQRGHTLVATISRGNGNRFTLEMISELARVVGDVRSHPGLRFVRIRAMGDSFCVGRDRPGSTLDELRDEAERIVALNESLRTSPLTIIAEVNGDAAGFGVGLVAASDIAVASRAARFWFPEIRSGLSPSVVIAWLTNTIGYKAAFDLVSTGEPIDAQRAASCGLITEAVPAASLEARVDERIDALAAMSQPAIREIKEFFVATRAMDGATAAAASVNALTVSALRVARERSGDPARKAT